jgi:hypothetical protein
VIFQVSRQPVDRRAIHQSGDRDEGTERQITGLGSYTPLCFGHNFGSSSFIRINVLSAGLASGPR